MRKKLVLLLMQRTFQLCGKDEVIAKIMLIKKFSNLVKTEEKKSKDIFDKKIFYFKE